MSSLNRQNGLARQVAKGMATDAPMLRRRRKIWEMAGLNCPWKANSSHFEFKSTENQGPSVSGKYLTFLLGTESYGLPVLKVREIIRRVEITPVPHVPSYVNRCRPSSWWPGLRETRRTTTASCTSTSAGRTRRIPGGRRHPWRRSCRPDSGSASSGAGRTIHLGVRRLAYVDGSFR